MKPGFALLLSRDGIGLLQRSGDGWLAVDEVSLDDADLAQKLETLRLVAEALARDADDPEVQTKLILPNSEILYQDIVLPRAEDLDPEIAIEDHLEGQTPYSVSELTYDYVISDGLAQVAIVARETLEEAETFASEAGFNPLFFSALPPSGSFTGEPIFGLTKSGRSLVAKGVSVERDHRKLTVSGAADLPDIVAPEISGVEPANPQVDPEPVPEFKSARGRAPEKPIEITQPSPNPARFTLSAPESGFQARAATVQALSGAFADVRNLGAPKPVPMAIAAGIALCVVVGWAALSKLEPTQVSEPGKVPEPSPISDQAPHLPEHTVAGLAGYSPPDAVPTMSIGSDRPKSESIGTLSFILPATNKQPTGLGPPARSHLAQLSEANSIAEMTRPRFSPSANLPAVSPSGAKLANVASNSPINQPDLGQPPVPSTAMSRAVAEGSPSAAQPESARSRAVMDMAVLSQSAPSRATTIGAADTLALLTQPASDADTGFSKPILGLTNNADRAPDADTPPVAPSNLLVEPATDDVVLVPSLNPDELEQLAGLRPNPRPEDLSPAVVSAEVPADPELARLQKLRPAARPSGLKPPKPPIQIAVNDASDVPLEQRPKKRPSKISQMAAQKIPQASPQPNPQTTATAAAITAPKKAPPRGRETSTVARRATMQNALATSKVSLIGVYGSDSKRRALVRLPSGRYVKVNVGDRIDGGKIASIGRNSIKYVKGGQSKTLKVPEG